MTSFNHANKSAMPFDFETTEFGKLKFVALQSKSALGVLETVITVFAFKSRETERVRLS